MFDPPHLFKNIRNNLLKHSFTADAVVSWNVIKELYAKDQSFPLKMAPKPTKKPRDPSIFKTLCQIGSTSHEPLHSVATDIAFLCQTGIFPESYIATSKFVQKFDSLLSIFNVYSGSSTAPFKDPITTTSSHISFLIESKE